MNYKPNDDILLYAKFSTAFVSGGSVSGLDFPPETATSWEAGIKADLLDRRLRTNLSLFSVKYENFQTAQSGTNFRASVPARRNSRPVSQILSEPSSSRKADR